MADPNTPSSDATASTISPLDMDWAQDELVPFLQSVFAQPSRSADDWQRQILFARHNVHLIPFYEDFPLTIECLRLTLLNSETLTPKELSKFMKVAEQGSQMCVRIFVRHAIRHGPYQLFSLGRDPSPDFPRGLGGMARGRRTAVRRHQTRTQTQVPAVGQGLRTVAQGPRVAAPAESQGASYAQLADENAALRRQMGALNLESGGRRGGREVQTGRSSQPRGGYNARPDRGHHLNQGPGMSQTMPQPPPQYAPGSFGGYNQPYSGSSMMYNPYAPATQMSPYGMTQQYPQHYSDLPQQQYSNLPQQPQGGWNGNNNYRNTQQANSSQSGNSSAYLMPPPQTTLVPQQVRGPDRQGQPPQHYRGASAGQQGQGSVQTQGLSVPAQEQASVSRKASSSVLHPEARPFTPGSNTTED
ncbi:hypothetical protein G6011_04127 [Alternaria panax]|uniref:Uncharacterized protein n=1 Tax=Alternaria panax TaxID=48097 RepID=A0AAD4NTL7_9PLEO|nr:hypothetical protein G6011_04127 [Alternaria panax]